MFKKPSIVLGAGKVLAMFIQRITGGHFYMPGYLK
jgi:hypothetical protein